MRTKDNALMESILAEIDDYYSQEGCSPSIREVAKTLDMSATTILRYLREMNERGMLEYDGKRIITEKISKSRNKTVNVPLIGSVSCGQPLLSEESVENYIRLPIDLLGSGEFFILRANGDSMVNAGIDDDDLVIVRKTTKASDGDIVVALVNNENTLKRLYRDERKRRIILRPENTDYEDIVVENCEIQGVAIKVLKDLKRR